MGNFKLISIILFQLSVHTLTILGEESEEWSHMLYLERGVELRWNSNDPEWLEMELSAPVTGYVSVGFSPNGAMKGSDIVLGWVDADGKPHILDMYAIGSTAPLIDESQDYELISGKESDGKTTIRFRRKWNTCDEDNDMIIGNDSSRLIWAIHQDDPVDNKPNYHGEHRGVRRTFIRNKVQHTQFPDQLNNDPSIKYWDVKMSQNIIDAEDDIYYCKIAKFPKMDAKQHLIGYRPLLQKGNEFSIHHIILYECKVTGLGGTENVFEQYADQKGGRCYTPNMPPEWGTYCTTVPIIWTAGSEGNMFPPHVGSPLGEEHGGTTYFMFEVHYDNPQFKSFVDSSGFRLFYTDKLRENEASSILIGTKISPFHVVPPKMTSFTTLGYCTSECTTEAIPAEGVTVTTVLLHAHRSGRKITLRHIRNGKELPPIAQENNYDFDYQQSRVVESRKILPGDELITECEYETLKKNKPAFGGLGTRDEMCMSFVYYYPKVELTECKTQQEFYSFLNALGIKEVEGDILTEINMPYEPKDWQTVDLADSPLHLQNSTYNVPLNALDAMVISDADALYSTVGDVIYDGIDWAKNGKSVESKWLSGSQYAFCTGEAKKRIPLKNNVVNFPEYEKYVKPIDQKCALEKPTNIGYQKPNNQNSNSNEGANKSPMPVVPAVKPLQSYLAQTKTITTYNVPVITSHYLNKQPNRVYANYGPPQTEYYRPSTNQRNGNSRRIVSPPSRTVFSYNYNVPRTRQYNNYRPAAQTRQYVSHLYRNQPQVEVQRAPLVYQRHYTTEVRQRW